jgi:type IV pilus assembly protein PilC
MQQHRIIFSERLNNIIVIQFTESMSALMSAGISLQDALSICAESSTKKQLSSLCKELLQCVTDGKRFHDALAVFSPSFSSLYIALIKLGETTNSLEKIFSQLANYLKRNREIKQKIKQALAYPITVCVTAIAVSVFIIIFIFPRIQAIFEVFNTGESAAAMQENFQNMQNSMWYICGILFLIVTAIVMLLRLRSYSQSLSLSVDHFILHIPIIGNIITILLTSDFAFSMEILCSSGIPFIQALEQSQEVIINTVFRNALRNCTNDIINGLSISKSFKQQKIIPSYVTLWISIGEKTGSAEKVFSQLHTYFEHEATRLITNITSAAEPIFILIAGSMIIFLVWRFVVPIFSLIGAL